MACLSKQFRLYNSKHWPGPRSLAATKGVSIDFLSSGYLDVSVPRVCFDILYIQIPIHLKWGFPHSDIPGSKPIGGSSGLNAAYHVLHRLSVPRHPPDALLRLIAESSRTGASPVDTTSPIYSAIFWLHKTISTPVKEIDASSILWGQDYATYSRCTTTKPYQPTYCADTKLLFRSSDFKGCTTAPSLWLRNPMAGGAGRNRTDDLLLAKQALSQLSYSPFFARLNRQTK